MDNSVAITISLGEEDENNFYGREWVVTFIIYLCSINLATRKEILPRYNCTKIEEIREFFLNRTSTVKKFSKLEKYTVDEVLELLSLPTLPYSICFMLLKKFTQNWYYKLEQNMSVQMFIL